MNTALIIILIILVIAVAFAVSLFEAITHDYESDWDVCGDRARMSKDEASRRLADAVRHFIAANPSLTEIVPSLASVRDALDDYDKCEEYE